MTPLDSHQPEWTTEVHTVNELLICVRTWLNEWPHWMDGTIGVDSGEGTGYSSPVKLVFNRNGLDIQPSY